jgi:hypothetical protein
VSLSWFSASPARRAWWVLPRLSRVVTMVAVLAGGLLLPVTAASAEDHPFSSFENPVDGAVLVAGTPVVIGISAFNGESAGIISVEVTLDEGASWQLAEQTSIGSWQFTFTPTEPGIVRIATRAATVETVEVPQPSHRIVVLAAPSPPDCPCVLRLPELSDRPVIHDGDTAAVELGLRFRTDRDGWITGFVFRSFASDPSLLTGHLWSGAGALLAEGSPQPLPDGEFQVSFATPVPVQTGLTYVVSYYTPTGDYASTEDYFTAEYPIPPFTTVVDAAGGSGVYRYGDDGGFPDQTWHASNYWVAPMFTTT